MRITFTFMHLAEAFIQSDVQCIQAIHVLPGNWTHNLRTANAMLYHWATGTLQSRSIYRPALVLGNDTNPDVGKCEIKRIVIDDIIP